MKKKKESQKTLAFFFFLYTYYREIEKLFKDKTLVILILENSPFSPFKISKNEINSFLRRIIYCGSRSV